MKNYIGIYETFSSYFKAYGGIRAILTSPYFHIALLFSTVLYVWINCFHNTSGILWYDLSLSILPNLLGFSIGAYAILLAVGDEGFWKILYEYDEDEDESLEDSIFMTINASLAHFVVIQVLALIVALIAKIFCLTNITISFIGTTLLIYAILMAVAAVMAIFKISKWYQEYIQNKNKILDDK